MDEILLRPYRSKSGLSFDEYIDNISKKSYMGLKRNNGTLIYSTHIKPMIEDMQTLTTQTFHNLSLSLIKTHDFEDFFNNAITEKGRILKSTPHHRISVVINPFDKRLTMELKRMNNYMSSFNYLVENGDEIANWLCYCLFKTSKRITDENRDYNETVLRETDMKYLNEHIDIKTRDFLDLMVILERLCDVRNNNSDPNEESSENGKTTIFKGKKLRNTLERKFLDLPEIQRSLLENQKFEYLGEKVFEYDFAMHLIQGTQKSMNQFLEINAPLDENILNHVQLGTRVNRNNWKTYQQLLENLYKENKMLFSKKPNLENYFI